MFASSHRINPTRTCKDTCAYREAKQLGVLRRFKSDCSGGVAILFGLIFIPLLAMVGLAIDFGRSYAVRSTTQSALDAAALAAGRAAQLATTGAMEKASAAATAFFNQAKPKNVVIDTLEFSPNSDNTEFKVTATSWVRTPILGVLDSLFNQTADAGAPAGCKGGKFACVKMKTTATAALCPSQACSGNSGGSNVEIALMLDVTGSMCSPCTKIDAAKLAAQDLVNIVVADDQSQFTSRVALAPFAEAVDAGSTLAPKVRGTVTSGTQTLTASDMSKTSVQPTKQSIKFPNISGGNTTWTLSTKCVTERIGVDKYTDTAPSSTATYVGKGYFGTDATTSCPVANHSDAEVNSIYPLTSDKVVLNRRIGKLLTAGSTAGHLGTAWAWYLLSPKWNTVLQSAFPATSPAGPYSDLTITNSRGMPKLRKIAVLMTDGDYNINYCKGTEAKNSDQSPDINCNSENAKSLAQATALCTAMKNPLNDGKTLIEVYTIGFQVSSAAKAFLTSCATNAAHYYDATSEVALQAAFRDIALKIASLRLTN